SFRSCWESTISPHRSSKGNGRRGTSWRTSPARRSTTSRDNGRGTAGPASGPGGASEAGITGGRTREGSSPRAGEQVSAATGDTDREDSACRHLGGNRLRQFVGNVVVGRHALHVFVFTECAHEGQHAAGVLEAQLDGVRRNARDL